MTREIWYAMVFGSLVVALVVYCVTFLLGLGITLRWWRTRTIHWLHHALFAAIWVSLLGATAFAWLAGITLWYAPLAVLVWMVPLPLLRPGKWGHRVLAIGGLLTFVAVFVLV